MKFRVIVGGLLAAAIAAPVQAQQCGSGTSSDACQKAADLLNYMTPQLSTALASGNPTLGQGGTLGGFGHFSLDIRASAVNGQLPQLNQMTLHATKTSDNIATKSQMIPAASLDAGIGLWRGISLGVTHVGGVDGIVTMTYLPNISSGSGNSNTGDIKVNGGNEKFGYGFRLGLLEESAVTPGVSFAWVQRDLPTVSYSGTVTPSGGGLSGTLNLENYSVNTSAWRVTAGKSFLIFGLSAGIGQDKYDASSTIHATVSGQPESVSSGSFAMTRTNMFVGAYVNLFVFKLEGELGQVSGGNATTFNTFNPAANASHGYFTLGLRFGR